MYFVRIVDKNGLFISDDFVEELTEYTIETPCPSGFYHPRWNGEEWIEGFTEEEIEELKNNIPEQEPNEVEILQQENKLLKGQVLANANVLEFQEEVIFELIMKVYD